MKENNNIRNSKIYENNIKLDYIYSFIKNFDLTNSIWVLYMAYRGIPLWQIGVLEGIFHLASLILEVPSGAAADLIGRKKTILLGRFFSAIYTLIMLTASNFWMFSFAFVISAWSYNFNSGSEEALVYDSMKLIHKEEEYLKVNSRLNIVIEVAQGLSAFLGGILSQVSFVLCYGASFLVSLCSFIPAMKFREPVIKKEVGRVSGLREHFRHSYLILKEYKEVRRIMITYAVLFACYTMQFFYSQQYYSEYGLSRAKISLILLAVGIVSCISAYTCEGLVKKLGNKAQKIAAIILAAGILGMGLNSIWLSILSLLLSSYANSALYPIHSDALNKRIPSAQRATILSVDSMVFSMIMVVIFPMAGFFAQAVSLRAMYLVTGALLFFIITNPRLKL